MRANENCERKDFLYKQTRKSFGDALLRAMAVADESDIGEPKKITQDDLADQAGVGRSTIAKYLATRTDDGVETNPDLKTLCRLAYALNVPPALLLMRPQDWQCLASASAFLSQAIADLEIQAISKDVERDLRNDVVSRSTAGLKLARRLGFSSRRDSTPQENVSLNPIASLDEEVEEMKDRMRLSILTTCALPPLGQMPKEYYAPLLSLCANLGATNTTT
ncbi:helix-turn-helix domain-containing protein [Herbaspirillum rubrisubalbicans]|uniref:helix-turn-helix domain-containing protein n=1 Tax=Herbaspirillum rubrisubalbicans TaxID=80842 RepID=UPI0009DA2333|nr:helix-turn-helix transcriptional regulator [Herbaspirillum rubrisubalbicans]